jgi:plasmid maintenance system antidote protein VapI
MKWCYEIRDAEMTDQVLLRGLQIAETEPQGPIYLTGAREVWEESTKAPRQALAKWRPSKQAGLTPKDLRPMIGETNRVYEILNYTRPLTLPMIRRLNASLGIPADALIGESKLCRNKSQKSTTAAESKLIKNTKISNAGKQKVMKSTKRIMSKASAR